MKFINNKDKYLEYLTELNHTTDNPNKEEFDEAGKPKTLNIMDMSVEDLDNINIDIFEILKYKVYQVAYGYATSLLITGQGGLGKSYDTEQALDDSKKPYESISGGISTAGLFELLFTRNGEIIVFDDCDSVFDSIDSVNILKAALDSKSIRKISRSLKTHFESKGMTLKDIMANYEGNIEKMGNKHLFDIKNKGKLPKTFPYSGRVIFISNLSSKDIDKVIIDRASAHIDVNLTHDEIINRMKMVIDVIHPDVPKEKKYKVLQLLDYLSTNYVTKKPLSIRGLLNAISTMISHDFTTKIGGRTIPMWQVLIKQDMIGKTVTRREK
tara:strand:+ start:4214 stop:5191 length:978 start_codon:yes stop_codon:yes gene_type:complete